MEKNEQQMRGSEAKREQEAIGLRSERLTCPRKEASSSKPRNWLCSPQAEEVREMVWHPEELDADLPVGWEGGIAGQTLGPREPKVRPLRPRKDSRSRAALAGWSLGLPDLNLLITYQLHTGSPMLPAAPVLPEERRSGDREGMQQDTDLARLYGGSTIPLALLAQGTETTTANTGSIDHAQAAIGFSTVFMWEKLLVGRAT